MPACGLNLKKDNPVIFYGLYPLIVVNWLAQYVVDPSII